MPSLSNAADRAAIESRLDRLSPDAPALWGKFNAPRMLAHIADAFRMALGELPVKPKNMPLLRMYPIKMLVLYVLPFPKSAPTAPEIVSRAPEAFEMERAAVKSLIARMSAVGVGAVYPEHPVFGKLSPAEWSTLGYKHLDHHLRQFDG